MKILAIDTTSKICSVALLENENIIDEINLDSGLTHSESLMPSIKKILEKNSVKLKDIKLIGVDVGPGSFTGIRIGVASVKAIAEILQIPVVSATSLEILSQNSEENLPKVVLIDARNDQVYCGIFDEKDNKVEDFFADDINNVIPKIDKFEKIIAIGDGAIKHKELLNTNLSNVKFSTINDQYARNLGKIAYKKFQKNELKNADTVLPIYLRNKM